LKSESILSNTLKELEIIQKCKSSPLYFIKNYIDISKFTYDDRKFILRDYQEELIQSFETSKITIGNMCRQSGKSLLPVLYALAKMMFNSNYTVSIRELNPSSSRRVIKLIREVYNQLPTFLKAYVGQLEPDSSTTFSLKNGSLISIEPNFLFGNNSDLIIFGEFAYWDRQSAIGSFASTYPIISSRKSSKMIILSTPNKSHILRNANNIIKQHFYDIWTDSNIEANRITIPCTRVFSPEKIAHIMVLDLKSLRQEYYCDFIYDL
jgi:hypothetical protein